VSGKILTFTSKEKISSAAIPRLCFFAGVSVPRKVQER
jgi:hypothetical protein